MPDLNKTPVEPLVYASPAETQPLKTQTATQLVSQIEHPADDDFVSRTYRLGRKPRLKDVVLDTGARAISGTHCSIEWDGDHCVPRPAWPAVNSVNGTLASMRSPRAPRHTAR
ncbi:uncharacterized protein BXZ73DRAFT_107040 [Epithele typhae]|uniref:uncharacterized protein n=1 Tax=Epithele typhae TaxID=378194 RepID=UPI002008CC4E|nr:uncharacterized protein BXZ73DRAFT_107040 [Epithele typhae]KAH9913064.1 hypothetical protein BXZ73DRAFT_107040 [Epithele typhae]